MANSTHNNFVGFLLYVSYRVLKDPLHSAQTFVRCKPQYMKQIMFNSHYRSLTSTTNHHRNITISGKHDGETMKRVHCCKYQHCNLDLKKTTACIEPRREKTVFAYVTAKLISAFVFETRIKQSLFFLNPKFQASSHLLWLHSPVCVGPGRKSRNPVFSQRGSI